MTTNAQITLTMDAVLEIVSQYLEFYGVEVDLEAGADWHEDEPGYPEAVTLEVVIGVPCEPDEEDEDEEDEEEF